MILTGTVHLVHIFSWLHRLGGGLVIGVWPHQLNAGQDFLLVSSQRHADPLEIPATHKDQDGNINVALKETLTVLPALHADAHVHVEVKYTLHAFGYKQQFVVFLETETFQLA